MRLRPRDNQRARVYAWERKVAGASMFTSQWPTLEECMGWAEPVWRKERARYGLARKNSPRIERPSWGQQSALAHADHRITLPKWARNPWVVAHELSHRLSPRDEAHGPRFVGILIGVLSRHCGYDVEELMASAQEMGVRYHVRSIGAVPVISPASKVERAIATHGAMTLMDLACWMDVPYKRVWGASLALIKQRRARMVRGKLQLIAPVVDAA